MFENKIKMILIIHQKGVDELKKRYVELRDKEKEGMITNEESDEMIIVKMRMLNNFLLDENELDDDDIIKYIYK